MKLLRAQSAAGDPDSKARSEMEFASSSRKVTARVQSGKKINFW